MIYISGIFIETEEELQVFCDSIKQQLSYREDYDFIAKEFEKFLHRCFEADQKLTDMVREKISEDYLTVIHIPVHEDEVLLQFDFALVSENDDDIKRREEILYQKFCDICFGNIQPFFYTVWNYYENKLKS